jgi:MFS transporter, UMF1 family
MTTQNKQKIIAWALYDWANSAFSTLILTFVFASYFTSSVMDDAVKSASLWSASIGISGLLLLVLSPIVGAIADRTSRLKFWICLFMMIMLVGLAFMDVAPHATMTEVYRVLSGLILANIGFELGVIIVNSYLPHIVPSESQGSVSSFAWGLGYVGGIVAMIVTLLGFIGMGDMKPWISLPRDAMWHVRSVLPISALWMIIFSLPLFFLLPSVHGIKKTRATSWHNIFYEPFLHMVRSIKHDKTWRYFLIGSAFYRDGLSTLFAMGGIYAATRYGMDSQSILIFAIGVNITGGLGCFISAYLERRIPSLTIVRFGLIGLFACGLLVLLAPTATYFLVFSCILGFFVGPVQSASRTLVVQLSSADVVGERFGIYSLSGRAVSFIGPFLFASLTQLFQSQTIGLSSVLLLWAIGYYFLYRVSRTAIISYIR